MIWIYGGSGDSPGPREVKDKSSSNGLIHQDLGHKLVDQW